MLSRKQRGKAGPTLPPKYQGLAVVLPKKSRLGWLKGGFWWLRLIA